MLDVLRHQDLEGVLAAAVRYYGGIKLGAGGLVRAYTDCVAQALLSVEKVAIVRYAELRCTLPYSLEGLLRRQLAAAGASLVEVGHAQRVTLAFRIAAGLAPALAAQLDEAASGQLEWVLSDDQ
jgi:putative IMPACT (imprinted ancient) family translation regulator